MEILNQILSNEDLLSKLIGYVIATIAAGTFMGLLMFKILDNFVSSIANLTIRSIRRRTKKEVVAVDPKFK